MERVAPRIDAATFLTSGIRYLVAVEIAFERVSDTGTQNGI